MMSRIGAALLVLLSWVGHASVAQAGDLHRTDNVEFAFWDADTIPDMFVVNKTMTASRHVELTIYSGSSNLQTAILGPVALNGASNKIMVQDESWDFRLADIDGKGKPDLVGIIRNMTASGFVEVVALSGESEFKTFIVATPTPWKVVGSAWDFDLADWDGDKKADLFAMLRGKANFGAEGPNSKMEVSILSAASFFKESLLKRRILGAQCAPGGFDPRNANVSLRLGNWDGDSKPDLFYVLKNGTASTKVETSILTGASNFGSCGFQNVSGFNHQTYKWTARIADWNADNKSDLIGLLYIADKVDGSAGKGWGSASNKLEISIASGRPVSGSSPSTFFSTMIYSRVTGAPLYAPTPSATEICPGVTADTTGSIPADKALVSCIQNTASGGALELPAGRYLLTTTLKMPWDKVIALRTKGLADSPYDCGHPLSPPCAVLVADPQFPVLPVGDEGILQVGGNNWVPAKTTVDHIVVDGNRASRLESVAADTCSRGQPNDSRAGFNIFGRGSGVNFKFNVSKKALCGTGMEWGGNAEISNNRFELNGDHYTSQHWSDGLSVLNGAGLQVTANRFIDNSDVGLILGSLYGNVSKNEITQYRMHSFAAFMMGNYDTPGLGDYTNGVISDNSIDCGESMHRCDFGMQLGQHAWSPTAANTVGGTVQNNTIRNAKQGVNIEGAGTAQAKLVFKGNAITGSPSSAIFLCGPRTTSNLNISKDSQVDRGGDLGIPNTAVEWHACE